MTAGGVQNVRIINEPNVYRLINHSKLPEAEQFEAGIRGNPVPNYKIKLCLYRVRH